MIDPKKLGLIAAILVTFTIVSVTVDRWWGARELATRTTIEDLQRGNAVRDLKIKGRDRALAELQRRDSVHVVAIAKDSAQLKVASTQLATAKAAIDSDAALHAGLVPIIAVHELEAKYDAKVASCEHLNIDKDARIVDLQAQIANQAATRADLDVSKAADATILKDTVAVLKPPWFRRFVGWLDDHVVTVGVGGAIGAVVTLAITKK